MAAGVSQAQNTNKGFGQGAEGYAKRYGAAYADFATSLLLEKVALSTVFKQDPRYFYKGTGSNRSRFFYAVSRSVICQGDNRKTDNWQKTQDSGIRQFFRCQGTADSLDSFRQ
jgi:hypothetical protein